MHVVRRTLPTRSDASDAAIANIVGRSTIARNKVSELGPLSRRLVLSGSAWWRYWRRRRWIGIVLDSKLVGNSGVRWIARGTDSAAHESSHFFPDRIIVIRSRLKRSVVHDAAHSLFVLAGFRSIAKHSWTPIHNPEESFSLTRQLKCDATYL